MTKADVQVPNAAGNNRLEGAGGRYQSTNGGDEKSKDYGSSIRTMQESGGARKSKTLGAAPLLDPV